MVVAAGPFSVSGERAPASVCTASVFFVGGVTGDGGGGALPEHRVGGVPPCAELELVEVAETDVVAVDIHDVKQQTGCPRTDAAAESEGFLAFARRRRAVRRAREDRDAQLFFEEADRLGQGWLRDEAASRGFAYRPAGRNGIGVFQLLQRHIVV